MCVFIIVTHRILCDEDGVEVVVCICLRVVLTLLRAQNNRKRNVFPFSVLKWFYCLTDKIKWIGDTECMQLFLAIACSFRSF